MKESSRIAKNTLYLYIKTGVSVLIVLYTTRIVLQSLGEVDFGIYSVVGGVISMLGFLNSAMALTIQRFLNFEQGRGDTRKSEQIFNVGLLFHIIIAIFITALMIIVRNILFDSILNIPPERLEASKIIYWCLIISTFITILTVPYDACIVAREDFLFYAIVGIIETILKLAIAIVIINSASDKLILYGALMAVIPFVTMTLMQLFCRLKYPECRISLKKSFDKGVAKELFSFAAWSLLGTSSNFVGNYGNMIVMNHYFGATLNAAMGIANQIQGQLMVLSTGMLKAINPVIARHEGAGQTERMMSVSITSCTLSYFLLAIFATPMLFETETILQFWLGTYPEWTILFVRLQLVRALFEQLTVSLNRALEAKGKIVKLNILSFVFNLLPIPLLCVLYSKGYEPYFHYIIAIASMVFVPSIYKVALCIKYCSLHIKTFINRVIFPTLVPTLIIFVIFHLIINPIFTQGLLRFILIFILSAIVQLLFILVCSPYPFPKTIHNQHK